VTSINPNPRPLGDAFLNDITRGYKQKAAYASVDFDLIPRTLTLTAGTRYFNNNNWRPARSQAVSVANSSTALTHPIHVGIAMHGSERAKATTGLIPASAAVPALSWKVNDTALLYYTWSQGFRAGGFNRGFATFRKPHPWPM
jgi:iron complex outermembrane receptor protein